MIGRIVVELLAVFCFSCIVTGAQLRRSYPKFNTSIVDDCGSYKPKASFYNIKGLGNVEETSVDPSDCLSVVIDDGEPRVPNSNVFSFSYDYPINSDRARRLAYLIQNPAKPGQAQLHWIDLEANTVTPSSTVSIVAFKNGTNGFDGFDGYAVVMCPIPVGDKQVLIAMSSELPQDAVVSVVSDLKAQLNATGLGGVKLDVINRNFTYCV